MRPFLLLHNKLGNKHCMTVSLLAATATLDICIQSHHLARQFITINIRGDEIERERTLPHLKVEGIKVSNLVLMAIKVKY